MRSSLDSTLHNRASVSGTYDTTGLAHANYSGQGMNGFGYPDSVGYGKQTTATIATPYDAALTDFTALVTFQHDSNGTIPQRGNGDRQDGLPGLPKHYDSE